MSNQTRRLYLDMDVAVADAAKEEAFKMRVPTKRYIEALIEADIAAKQKKGAKTNGNTAAKK